MKHFLSTLLVLQVTAFAALGQSSSPTPPSLTDTGVTFSEVMDYMRSMLSPDDTGEGGAETKLGEFEFYWSKRVQQNDSSGLTMFARYDQALARAKAATRLA